MTFGPGGEAIPADTSTITAANTSTTITSTTGKKVKKVKKSKVKKVVAPVILGSNGKGVDATSGIPCVN
jgi:hypothetical protein